MCIIKDMAKGLAFLHQSLPSQRVPQANLKSSNALIHQNHIHGMRCYDSKLTNLGFLPLLRSRKSCQRLAVGRSPEFCRGKKLTHKADIYCFGIILLEVITGRIPGEKYLLPGSGSGSNDDDDEEILSEVEASDDLCEWVRMVENNDWSTDILDVEILGATDEHGKMLKLTEIALDCTDMATEKRPTMSEVLRRIQEINMKTN